MFLFSGTEVEGQLLVVLTPDATIEKTVQANRVVNVTGSLVPFTAEDLEAAGAGLSLDDDALAEFEGDIVLVGIRKPPLDRQGLLQVRSCDAQPVPGRGEVPQTARCG